MLLDPPGHGDIGQAHDVVAVHVGHEHGRQRVRRAAGFHQTHDRGATGINLDGHVPVSDQRAGTGSAGPGVGHSRAGERHLGGHSSVTFTTAVSSHAHVPDGPDPFDPSLEDLARLQEPWRLPRRADAGRRAGEEHIAGEQRKDSGQLGDQAGHAEDGTDVRASCTVSPSTEHPSARSSTSGTSSSVASHGPIGP